MYLFPKEMPSNTAAGTLGEGLAEASTSPKGSFDLGYDQECRCSLQGWPQGGNSIRFYCHPREAKFCCLAMAVRRSLPGSSRHPESCSEAAYRCNPGTAARAAGRARGEPKPTGLSACPPNARAGPLSAAAPSPRLLLASALAWFGEEAGSPRGSAGSGRGWGAAEASPPVCGKPGSGKVFQVPSSACPGRLGRPSRRGQARQPPRRHRRQQRARSRQAGRAPGGQPLLPGREPQLTQAARKAEAAPLRPLGQPRGAYTWSPDGRAQAPGPRRPRGRSTRGAAGVPEQRTLPSSSRALPALPLGPCSGRRGSALDPPNVYAGLRVPDPQALPSSSQYSPSTPTRRGVAWLATPPHEY
ncbi:collagen alpha-1(I) chain-like [Equus asinus]|uniref:collagen alpha-1(I) chain-like n=1 Tax=Equus asinus TaxID=9793 RepID=UPI0038F682E0